MKECSIRDEVLADELTKMKYSETLRKDKIAYDYNAKFIKRLT